MSRSSQRKGIEGMVIVRFVENTEGSIQDIELLRTIGEGADEVAQEVIENSPNWNPLKMSGRSVRSRMTKPIQFKLKGSIHEKRGLRRPLLIIHSMSAL